MTTCERPRVPAHRSVPYLGFAVLLSLDVIVAVVQKLASNGAVIEGAGMQAFYWNLLHQPLLWVALALAPAQLWMWTRILHDVEISVAYPVTSLAYPLIMIVSQTLLHEHLALHVWIGGASIATGVCMVAGSSGSRSGESPQ